MAANAQITRVPSSRTAVRQEQPNLQVMRAALADFRALLGEMATANSNSTGTSVGPRRDSAPASRPRFVRRPSRSVD